MSDKNIDPKVFEYVVFQHDPNKKLILEALDIVRNFIIDNKLVITGGMAVDYALRLKGEKLYDDTTLPDYDFFSPEHNNHAYELGSILCKKLRDENGEMPNISVIDALHITTMKVRVNFIVVADITYLPLDIFEKLHTLEYTINNRNIKFRHPHFQMIDQHRALSMPYENAPREVILSRFKKDMKRFDLLYKHYPIAGKSLTEGDFTEVAFNKKILENACLCGTAGLYMLIQKSPNPSKFGLIKNTPLVLLSYQAEHTASIIMDIYKESKLTYYNAYLDILPQKISIELKDPETPITHIDIYDTAYKLISSEKYTGFDVADTQFSMCYFNLMSFLDEKNNELYRNCYITLAKLVEEGIKKPTHITYGSLNIGMEHILQRAQTLSMNKDIPRIKIAMKPGRYYPSSENNCQIPINLNSFSYEESPLFHIDGVQVERKPVKIVDLINPLEYDSSSGSDSGSESDKELPN
jgi:hypothetical protein